MSAERAHLAAVQIPDFELGSGCKIFGVSTAGRQQLAVATDGNAAYFMLESCQCPEQFAFLGLPDFDLSIRPRGEQPAIGTVSQRQDRALVSLDRKGLLAAASVPNLDRAVTTCRSQMSAVRTERHAIDGTAVAS